MHLPYTDVIVSLDCLNHYNPNLWALAKIKAYQSIKEPFIHVDGDVFIWTKIDESLRDHELIVQNEETTTDYYGKMWRDIRHAISYMPEEMKRYDLHIDNKAYNMGIFGGTDIDFIQRYTYKAFDFEIKISKWQISCRELISIYSLNKFYYMRWCFQSGIKNVLRFFILDYLLG